MKHKKRFWGFFILLVILGIIFFTPPIDAVLWINKSDGFKVPFNSENLASNGTDFWFFNDSTNFTYHYNSTGDNQTDGFHLDITFVGGLTLNDTQLWYGSHYENRAYCFTIKGINCSDGFPIASASGTEVMGFTTNGTDFWSLRFSDATVTHYNSAGTILGTFNSQGNGQDHRNFATSNGNDFLHGGYKGPGSGDFLHINNSANLGDGFSYGFGGAGDIRGIAIVDDDGNISNGGDIYAYDNADKFIYHFSTDGFRENTQTFNSSTLENSTDSFLINITYDTSKYSNVNATLYYGETSYNGTRSDIGNDTIFEITKEHDLINSDTNYTFYWKVGLYDGTWNLFDSLSNIQQVNFTSYLRESSQTYPSSTIENSIETFITNVSYDTEFYTLSSASLWYNGTIYPATKTTSGSNIIFTKELTIPLNDIPNNKSFKWLYYLINSTGTINYNSTENNHFVNRTNASILNNPYSTNFINFTIYDEETLQQINSTFEATINYGLTSLIRNLTYSDTSQSLNSFSFGFDPIDKNFLVEGNLEYSKTGYITRVYTLPNQTLNNITTNVNLYLLNSSDSTSFIVFVRDSAFSEVEGASVHIQRYYPGTDNWETVEIVTTNYEGKAIGHFVTEDVNYRFLVYVNNVLSLTTTSTKIFCESTPCTITLTLEGDIPFKEFINITDLTYSLVYSKSTNVFTYTYTDTSSLADGGRLIVIKASYGNATEQTICDKSSTSSSAILTCDISTFSNGTYYALAYNERTTQTTLLDTLIVSKVRDIVDNIGLDGVIWSVFLIIGIVMVGLFKPAIAITMAIASVILIGLLGLVSLPAVSIAAIIIIGVILIWGVRS